MLSIRSHPFASQSDPARCYSTSLRSTSVWRVYLIFPMDTLRDPRQIWRVDALESDVWNSTFRCLWQSEIFDSLDSFWNPKIWISSVKILHIREGASQKINKLSIFRMCKAAYRLDKKRYTSGTQAVHTVGIQEPHKPHTSGKRLALVLLI